MRLNSPYKKLIDSAILHLKEGGVLHRYTFLKIGTLISPKKYDFFVTKNCQG